MPTLQAGVGVSAPDHARLEALAAHLDEFESGTEVVGACPICGEAADALRDYAKIVRVLGDKRLSVGRSTSPFGVMARIGNIEGHGTDHLVAILALAEALEKEAG